MPDCLEGLSGGRSLPCLSGMSGYKNIYLASYSDTQTFGVTASGEINSLGSITTAYKFELEPAASTNTFDEVVTAAPENGNTYIVQTLTFTLAGFDKVISYDLRLVARSRVYVFVETLRGEIFIQGVQLGARLTGGTRSTGAAAGDMQGLSGLAFVSNDDYLAPTLTPAAKAALLAITVEND